MSRKRRKHQKASQQKSKRKASASKHKVAIASLIEQARDAAIGQQFEQALQYYQQAEQGASSELLSEIANDRGALAAAQGQWEQARHYFRQALSFNPENQLAQENVNLLPPQTAQENTSPPKHSHTPKSRHTRIAVVSLLFNWPSTGGGNVHTAELVMFLGQAGYEVKHFYAEYPPWGIGKVSHPPFPAQPLPFTEADWHLETIQQRFREVVQAFQPDWVIITDSWNMKPRLAQAVSDFPVLLRLQAMECLCPLNNVRLLIEPGGKIEQCNRHQLATVDACRQCLQQRGQYSGTLHQAERALSGVGSQEYQECLVRAFQEAEAVLAVNPLTEAMVSPFTKKTQVIPSGMDAARFPWPPPISRHAGEPNQVKTLFFAGLVEEPMKGYHILQAACEQLWKRRQDFHLIATGDPPGPVNPFTTFVGWLSQEELPQHLWQAEMLIIPTIAQEALGRTAVEAMAAGCPVIASRIGGLPTTVTEGEVGLLVEPGNVEELREAIEKLLDHPEDCQRLGQAGRQRFEHHYSWEVIIQNKYVPLLGSPEKAPQPTITSASLPLRTGERGLIGLQQAFCWPQERPQVSTQIEHPGWFADGARAILSQELSQNIQCVVEVGAWLGLSTRFIADCVPQAMVITIDHWQGSPEHQRRPEWQQMLPTLYDTFLALCWDYRQRMIPIKQSSREGLKTIAEYGVTPDLIYLDSEHSYNALSADLELCTQLFPGAIFVGDDYQEPEVQEALQDFVQRHQWSFQIVGTQWPAWKIDKSPRQ